MKKLHQLIKIPVQFVINANSCSTARLKSTELKHVRFNYCGNEKLYK